MKVHVISETSFVVKGTGVHTAFLEHVSLLREKRGVTVVVNGEGRGDVLHSHTYFLYYIWKGIRYRGRRVMTVHVTPDSARGSLPAWKILMPMVHWWLKQVYSFSDVCIAISPTVEKAVRATGAKTRTIRIDNPVIPEVWARTADRRSEGRKMLGLADDDFVVLGVGQLQGRKGIDDFVDIAGAVTGAKFVWAGGRPFGPLTEGLIRIENKLRKAGDRIIVTGNLPYDRMPLVYSASDLMLFPSWQENCPLAPLEAAASGMPVIFRDLEEYRCLYENPYLKAADKNEYIFLTEKMIRDKDFYSKGVELSSGLIKQFDRNVIIDKLMKVYSDLLTETKGNLK